MREQVAKLKNRIVEVIAEHRLAKVFDENPPDRAAAIEDAAVMARAGPELVAFLGVIDERTEEGRLQCCRILLQATDQVARNELRRLLREENVAVDKIKHLDRDVFEALAADEDHDRHLEAAAAHQIDQRRRLSFEPALAPVDHHAADRGVGLDCHLGILNAPRLNDLEPVILYGCDDSLKARTFEVVGVEAGYADQKSETSEEIHRHAPFVKALDRIVP